MRRLFIAELEAQYSLWKNHIVHEASKSDEVFQLGNILTISEDMKDKEKYGPNEAILNYVDLYQYTHDGWNQIVGPNEITILNNPEKWTNERTDFKLRNLYFSDDPFFKIATVSEGRLVTHGGLTYGEWNSIGRPETAEEAADELNQKYSRSIYMGDSYLITGRPNFSANPVFADPLLETYPSWIGADVSSPFHQIHTGRSVNSEEGRRMVVSEDNLLHFIDRISYQATGSFVLIKEAVFTNVKLDFPRIKIDKFPDWSTLLIEREAKI